MVWLAPLVWVLNWLSYLNGSAHRSNHRSFFSGKETHEQLGLISRYSVKAWPAVVARGLLAMFRYDATATLATIPIPTLIVDGDHDTTCKPEASDRMGESIPKARRATLRSARHGGVFEFHQEFSAAIHQMISTALPESDQGTSASRRTIDIKMARLGN
jgi:pimeloyl-ACP methyl ester carboxylesterase